MSLNTMLLNSRSLFAMVIYATLITSCSRDLEYKRRQTTPETIEPALPTTPTQTPAPTAYLSLTKSEAKAIYDQSNVVIENLRFENIDGIALNIKKSNNIIIKNCFFNKATAEAINIEGSANISVENCLFNGVTTGVYAMESQTIKISNNQFVNVRKDTSGGRGQFVQFNEVTGAGNAIENNQGENFYGESNPEDLISFFKSSGTAGSPILVRNNMFRGGGPSASGGGIMTGDYGGGYIVVANNTLLNPGNHGIAVAGGSNISILDNKIFAIQQAFSNNPLYVWAQAGVACSNIIVKGNRANWTNMKGERNYGWNSGNCDSTSTSFEYPTTISLEEMKVPEHLITMITLAELLEIRK